MDVLYFLGNLHNNVCVFIYIIYIYLCLFMFIVQRLDSSSSPDFSM